MEGAGGQVRGQQVTIEVQGVGPSGDNPLVDKSQLGKAPIP